MNTRIITYLCTLFVPLFLLVTPSFAVHDNGAFELEGNAVDDLGGGYPGDDWDTVLLGGGGLSFETTGVIADGEGPSIFTGGRKDIQPIEKWGHKSGAVPDKDEITNAYAAAYSVAGDLVIYFGADRIATDGDAFMGFWLFQDNIRAESDGSFSGTHKFGDLLVLANFSKGGSIPEIQVLEWVGSGGDQKQGTLNLLYSDVAAKCGSSAGDTVCAIVNDSSEPSPWPYTPKGGSLGDDFPPRAFFEGGVNISDLFANGELPCFASFMAETRSSTEVVASLKDFALDSFDVCGIEITKSCTNAEANATEDGYVYTYGGTVTNTGFGTLYDVTVTDHKANNATFSLGNIAANTTVNYGPRTFESTTTVAQNSVSVAAATSSGGDKTVTDGPIYADCPPLDRDPRISVTKDCDLTVEDQGALVALKLNISGQVCNDTGGTSGYDPVTLKNVTVTDDRGTTETSDDQIVLGPINLAPDTCQPYANSYLPGSVNDTSPALVYYEDEVTAVGFDKLTNEQVEDSAPAKCDLCPSVE